ncbi:MAG TPA: hypothetical protein VIY69_12090 [Candidatus Acidoferrales bacterium]
MPDWNRLIVGDAFRVTSRDFNYYRDLFLFWPICLFAIATLSMFFRGERDYRLALLLAVCISALLLAKERSVLIAAVLGFCASQAFFHFGIKHDWVALEWALICGTLFLALLLRLARGDHKLSYKISRGGPFIADFLVGLPSLGFAILVIRWITR